MYHRIQWDKIITINKGEMDDDERKGITAARARAFMNQAGCISYQVINHARLIVVCGKTCEGLVVRQ